MGQQQLLLLVLGTIIVGVAIVVGINIFSSGAVQANQDAMVQDNMTLASRIINYGKTPSSMGGGFNTTTGHMDLSLVTLDKINWPSRNANGSWNLTGAAASTIEIQGTGNECGPVKSVLTVVTTAAGTDSVQIATTFPNTF